MIHLMIAAVLLWSVSAVLCLYGDMRNSRTDAWRWYDAWDAAQGRYEREAQFHSITKGALSQATDEIRYLRDMPIEVMGPDHLGRLNVVRLPLAQWRLFEQIMHDESRIQRRPLDPPYLVVSSRQYHDALSRQTAIRSIAYMPDSARPSADARIGDVYFDRIPVHVERT